MAFLNWRTALVLKHQICDLVKIFSILWKAWLITVFQKPSPILVNRTE